MKREEAKDKPKKQKDKKIRKWIITYAVSAVVLMALMGYFLIVSKNHIEEQVEKNLKTELDNDVANLLSSLEVMTSSGQTMAKILESEGIASKAHWGKAAEILCETTDAYAVTIVDTKGEGISNLHKEVSLEELDYFKLLKVQAYLYAENDYLTGEPAIISVIPIKEGNDIKAMLYLYYNPDELKAKVSLKAGKRNEVFCLIDNEGEYINFVGINDYFKSDENFYNELRGTVSLDKRITSEQLAKKIKNSLSRFCYTVKADGTEKVIVGKSLKIRSWYMLHIMDQTYIDTLIDKEWKPIKTIMLEILLVVTIFYVVIIMMDFMNYRENKETRMALKDEAETDLLTGLNNKMATEKKIKQYIEENPGETGMFIIFDIDNFKKINDTKGHAFGDEVLKTLGERLLCEYRYSDILGRTGGDEFILFLKGIKEGQTLEAQKKRLNNFFKDFSVGSYAKYSPTASIGVSLYPQHGRSYQELYESGDKALYEAKRNGKNQLVVYEESMMGPNPAEFKGRE